MTADAYSKEERALMLKRIGELVELFYPAAVNTGCHAFIEFTGLLNEFLRICADAEARGETAWADANVHSGRHLPLPAFRHAYLSEKLECIYGAELFKNPVREEAFAVAQTADVVLAALAVGLMKEPDNLTATIHAVSHVVPRTLTRLGEAEGKDWLRYHEQRYTESVIREFRECAEADTTDPDALAKLRAVATSSLFGAILTSKGAPGQS